MHLHGRPLAGEGRAQGAGRPAPVRQVGFPPLVRGAPVWAGPNRSGCAAALGVGQGARRLGHRAVWPADAGLRWRPGRSLCAGPCVKLAPVPGVLSPGSQAACPCSRAELQQAHSSPAMLDQACCAGWQTST